MRFVVNIRTSVSGLNDNEAAKYPIAFSLNVDEDMTSTTWNEAQEKSYPYICNYSQFRSSEGQYT